MKTIELVKLSVYCSILFLSSRTAVAQQNGCESIIKNGLYDYFHDSSDSHSGAQIRSEVSRVVNQMSKDELSGNVQASYGLFSGSVSFSSSQLKALSDAFGSSFSDNHSQEDVVNKSATVLNGAAVEAWRACTTQVHDGLMVYFDVPDDPFIPVHFQVRYVAPVGASAELNINGVRVTPQGAFSCKWTADGKDPTKPGTVRVHNGNQVGFDCQRTVNNTPVQVGNRKFQAVPVRLTVQTDHGEASRPFSGIPAGSVLPSTTDVLMAAFPRGTILSWYARASVPLGWAICDGSHGTPNLDETFLIGTKTPGSVGQVTGSNVHSHSVSISMSGQTNTARPETGGVSDGWRQVNGRGSPEATGLDHKHAFSASGAFRTDESSTIPHSVHVVFIMKL
jgi:hypothetical protein